MSYPAVKTARKNATVGIQLEAWSLFTYGPIQFISKPICPSYRLAETDFCSGLHRPTLPGVLVWTVGTKHGFQLLHGMNVRGPSHTQHARSPKMMKEGGGCR